MKPRLEKLEALRAFACIGVFTFHCYISGLGAWAVSVFVVLSGFLLTYNSLDKADRMPVGVKGCAAYAWKKIRRMYPLYFITLLLLALRIFLLAPENPDINEVNIFKKQFILCVLLIQSWPPNTLWSFSFNAVGWYLSTSVVLYFAFPYILRRISRIKSCGSAIAAIVIIYIAMNLVAGFFAYIFRNITGTNSYGIGNFQQWFSYVFPPFRLGDFTIGCLFAYIFSRTDSKDISPAKATFFEGAAIVLFVISQAVFNASILPVFFNFNMLFIPSSVMLVYSFAIGKGHISRFLTNKVTKLVADYSVEIFLIHVTVIKYASPISTFLPIPYFAQQVFFLSFVVLVTFFSCLIYRKFSQRFPFFAVK